MIGVVIASLLAGVISGMGIGGGTILIPSLLFLQDMTQQQAQGINLIYFVPTAVIALITHKKNGNIKTNITKKLILPGLLGAVAGAFLAVQLDDTILRKCFAGFLFCMGLTELFKKKDKVQNTKHSSKKTGNTDHEKEWMKMDTLEFASIKARFGAADLDKKIDIYVNTKNLTVEQYKELLRMYPQEQIGRLEKALQ